MIATASLPAPPLGPFGALGAAFAQDVAAAARLGAMQAAAPVRGGAGLVTAIALAALAVALAWPIRMALLRALGRLLQRRDPQARFHVEAKAASTLVVSTILIGFSSQLALWGLEARMPLIAPFKLLAATVVAGFAVAGLGFGVGRALRSPDVPEQQPLALPPGLGAAAGFYPAAGGVLLGCVGAVQRASAILNASPLSWDIVQGALLLIALVLLVRLLIAVGRSREAAAQPPSGAGRLAFTLAGLAWAALFVAVGAVLFGHLRFAVMLVEEIVWAGLVLIAAVLIGGFLEALIAVLLGDERAAGRFAVHIIGVNARRIAQLRILAGAAAMVALWVIAFGLAVAPLGGAGLALVDQVRPALVFRELHQLHLSPRAIAVAALILVGGVLVTRLIRHWLERRFLPATALDIGVRMSILTGVSYAGVLIAILAASSALGVALDKITLIASALSVGIGFGLQSIIQNFVSGVILLVERPIKVGDWVSAAGSEGQVRRIRVRATELAMADGSVAIVPNSSFISAPVQNRTAAGLAGRIEITAKVSGSDGPAQARELLQAMLAGADGLPPRPPAVLLTDVADGTYGFALHIHSDGATAPAELKSRLLGTLAEGAAARGLKISLS